MTLEELISEIEDRLNEHKDCADTSFFVGDSNCDYIEDAVRDVPKLITALRTCIKHRDALLDGNEDEITKLWLNNSNSELLSILQGVKYED